MVRRLCDVGKVRKRRAAREGFSFDIVVRRGRGSRRVLTLGFRTQQQAENARFIFDQTLVDVIDVVGYQHPED